MSKSMVCEGGRHSVRYDRIYMIKRMSGLYACGGAGVARLQGLEVG